MKPSALIDPGLESKEEQEAAEAGLDLWPGMAGEQKETLHFTSDNTLWVLSME